MIALFLYNPSYLDIPFPVTVVDVVVTVVVVVVVVVVVARISTVESRFKKA